MELLAKDFATRQQLESKVASQFGLTADAKPTHLIKGTRAELKQLSLANGKVFWGIRVEATDEPAPPKTVRVDRGKIHKDKLPKIDIKKSKEQ